ncbi:hypothetical protein B566_EDAN000698 [Ephemera danica]|nr:hypothetical protein B566_EDAN000698 [Ephemera danica]
MSFPYEIKDVDSKTDGELKREFKGTEDIFVQVSPKKYILPQAYRQHASSIYEFEIRPDDIWVSTFPRSGTTLMQEIVWLIANDFDYETASKTSLNSRFPFIDLSFMIPADMIQLFRASVEDATTMYHNIVQTKRWAEQALWQ